MKIFRKLFKKSKVKEITNDVKLPLENPSPFNFITKEHKKSEMVKSLEETTYLIREITKTLEKKHKKN